MTLSRLARFSLGAALALGTAHAALAQGLPDPVAPPKKFKTSTEHYQYLYNLYDGGTQHSWDTVPKWEGLWSATGNSIRGSASPFFVEGTTPAGLGSGGEIAEGVLSPEYEEAFRMRRARMEEYGEQPYDRLTTCEPAGMPRWLLEPYVREFVNTPTQSWWMNDLANDTRRIHIGQEHENLTGNHFPNGDSIGFWVDDMLIVHTVDVWPNDYFRGWPPTSNQFESVEIFQMETLPNGQKRLIMHGTFYDEIGLTEPLNVVYAWQPNIDLETANYRIRHWECESNAQTRLADDNVTTAFAVPGEKEFMDIRGSDAQRRNPDLPPDLPGQTRSPEAAGLSLDDALGGN